MSAKSSLDQPAKTVFWKDYRFWALVSLIGYIVIVVTGSWVRLSKSGLGCDTWPKCTENSLTATADDGIHGVIEYGNRLLTVVLLVISIATLISLKPVWKTRRDLFWRSIPLMLLIPIQAIIGGITVLSGLNPYVVILHFLVSMPLIYAATSLLIRSGWQSSNIAKITKSKLQNTVSYLLVGLTTLVIILGSLVTASGPHAGDVKAPRTGFDLETVTKFHSSPSYLLLAVTVLSLLIAKSKKLKLSITVLLSLQLIQMTIGIAQSLTGYPVWLVQLHLLGVALIVSQTTRVWYRFNYQY